MPEFTFDEEKHIYRLANGQAVPGHTRVLDLGGLVPYAAVSPDILERKSEIGRQVHRACFLYDQGARFTVDRRIEGHVDAWERFCKESRFAVVLSEHQGVYCLNGLYFGMTIDALGYFAGRSRETVVERKTTSHVLPHHGVQLAAQAACVDAPICMVTNTVGIANPSALKSAKARFLTRDRIVVQLKEDGKYKIERFTQNADLEMFEHALALTYWKMSHEKTYKEMPNAEF